MTTLIPDATDTQRARTCAALLADASRALDSAAALIASAGKTYPDTYAEPMYAAVITNLETLRGYVRMLRVPALAYAGDVDALEKETTR